MFFAKDQNFPTQPFVKIIQITCFVDLMLRNSHKLTSTSSSLLYKCLCAPIYFNKGSLAFLGATAYRDPYRDLTSS